MDLNFKAFVKKFLPKSLFFCLVEKRNKYFKRYFIKSYSQEGEDILLLKIFGFKKNGFYVDVGAHHPKRFSNTYLFYRRGWRGINIDAMPGSMKAFNKIRKRDINIEKPISDVNQTLTFYSFKEPALNSLSETLSLKRIDNNEELLFKQELQTARIEEILDNFLPVNQKIDFLSIDVEGLDFNVLKSNNFKKYSPKVIIIEILENNIDILLENEITLFMKEMNYKIQSKPVNSVVFIKNNQE